MTHMQDGVLINCWNAGEQCLPLTDLLTPRRFEEPAFMRRFAGERWWIEDSGDQERVTLCLQENSLVRVWLTAFAVWSSRLSPLS